MKTLKFLAMALAVGFTAASCDEEGDDGENPSAKKSQVYASSNTEGKVSKTEYEDGKEEEAEMESFDTENDDADGIYFDSDTDILYQFDRSNGRLVSYTSFSANNDGTSLSVSGSATGGIANGREIAKSGNKVVVAQDADSINGNVNAFYIYEDDGNGNLTLDGIFITTINLWGIRLDGSTMYAIEDNSNNLCVFNDFFANTVTVALAPDMKVSIEGIVRTHGLDYDASTDVMVLTDIGDAGSDADGGIHIITEFTNKLNAAGNGGTIALDGQVRITNPSFLGNPVDCAYDAENKLVFVAERANGGGRIMAFTQTDASAIVSPIVNTQFAGASAVHLTKEK